MITLFFLLFAALAGDVEAILYARLGAECYDRNEHVDLVLQRIAVLLVLLGGLATWWRWHSPLQLLLELVAAALAFACVHDEAYNFGRLWISWRGLFEDGFAPIKRPWYLRWMSAEDATALVLTWRDFKFGYQSPTTTAVHDLPGRPRLLLAGAGLATWAFSWYWVLFR